MNDYALVSTVDSMGQDFPGHCVILFDTKHEAILYAVNMIVKHDRDVEYIENEGVWKMHDDHWDNPEDFLNAWQEGLDSCEYFHVKPVSKRRAMRSSPRKRRK